MYSVEPSGIGTGGDAKTAALTWVHSLPMHPDGRNAKDVRSCPSCAFGVHCGSGGVPGAAGTAAIGASGLKAISFWVPRTTLFPFPIVTEIVTVSPAAPLAEPTRITTTLGVGVCVAVLVGDGGVPVMVGDGVAVSLGVGVVVAVLVGDAGVAVLLAVGVVVAVSVGDGVVTVLLGVGVVVAVSVGDGGGVAVLLAVGVGVAVLVGGGGVNVGDAPGVFTRRRQMSGAVLLPWAIDKSTGPLSNNNPCGVRFVLHATPTPAAVGQMSPPGEEPCSNP